MQEQQQQLHMNTDTAQHTVNANNYNVPKITALHTRRRQPACHVYALCIILLYLQKTTSCHLYKDASAMQYITTF